MGTLVLDKMIFSISWCLLIFSFYLSLEVQGQKSTKVTKNDIKNGCASKSPNGDCPTDSVPEMIRNAGFKMVNYTVVTKDGYYLTVFRIPFTRKESKAGYHQPKNGKKPGKGKQQKAKAQKGKPQNGKAKNGKPQNGKAQNGKKKVCKKQPVLMVHGLFGDASHFVMHDVDKAPAYVLADQGYDVWLQNSRGSVYSQKHKTYQPTTFSKFWDFSHVELGNYDIPAVLDAIIKVTGCPKVIYVGHSLGTTQFFSGMALQPAQNKKIKCMIGLAPVAYVDDIKSVIKPFAVSAPAIQAVTAISGEFEFGANNTHAEKLKALACSNDVVQTVMCQNLLFLVAGFDSPQVYKPWFPTIVAHVPGPASSKTMVHLAQGILSKKFALYRKLTDLKSPKEIDLKKVTAPVMLFKGDNDYLADMKDMNRLRDELGNVVLDYDIPYEGWNHMDFLWGKEINKYINKPMLEALKNNCK